MYLTGGSVRQVEGITQALWGMRVNAGTARLRMENGLDKERVPREAIVSN